MLPFVYDFLRQSAALRALVGTRIYRHGAAPQGVVAPYLTWFSVTGVPENSLEATPRADNYSIQIDCWSDNTGTGDAQIEVLAETVRDALEPFGHMTSLSADGRDYETQRYRMSLSFTLWKIRDSSTPYNNNRTFLALSGDEGAFGELLGLEGEAAGTALEIT